MTVTHLLKRSHTTWSLPRCPNWVSGLHIDWNSRSSKACKWWLAMNSAWYRLEAGLCPGTVHTLSPRPSSHVGWALAFLSFLEQSCGNDFPSSFRLQYFWAYIQKRQRRNRKHAFNKVWLRWVEIVDTNAHLHTGIENSPGLPILKSWTNRRSVPMDFRVSVGNVQPKYGGDISKTTYPIQNRTYFPTSVAWSNISPHIEY